MPTFSKSSNDPNKCNGRSTFAGMLRRMQSPEFLINLGIMYDALFELSNLSLLPTVAGIGRLGKKSTYLDLISFEYIGSPYSQTSLFKK